MDSAINQVPVSAARFRVEIAGVAGAGFSSCRGLGGASRLVAIEEGGRETPRLFHDGIRWEPLCLERGIVSDPSLWQWFLSGEPRDGAVALVGPDGVEVGRWTFERGRAARWRAPPLDASARNVAIEMVEIVHEGLRWEGS